MTYYILKIYTAGRYNVQYYKGSKYIVLGEQYAVDTNDIEEAKRYSTAERAKDALLKLYESCVNIGSNASVMEIEDDGAGLLKYKEIGVPVSEAYLLKQEHKKRKTKTSTAVKARYNRNHYTRLSLEVQKEMAQQFKDKCAAEGVSVQSVLKAAIKDFLEK